MTAVTVNHIKEYFMRNGWKLPSDAVIENCIKACPDKPIDFVTKIVRNSAAAERRKSRGAQDSSTRRSRLHRALDRVLNASGTPICPVCNHSDLGCVCKVKDGRRGLPYDHPRILAIRKKIQVLEDKRVPYDDPRIQKYEAEIRRLEGN